MINRIFSRGLGLVLLAVPLLWNGARQPLAARALSAPCVRPQRAGTRVSGDVKICAGRYRIADPAEVGVLVVTGGETRIDLTGVTLESGDSVAERYVGRGIVSNGVDSVTIHGGRVRGYRFGIWLEGGRGHQVHGVDLTGSRRQALRSTPATFDQADWLDLSHPATFESYGGGIYLKRTEDAVVSGIVAREAQNGIGLFESRGAMISDNDVSGNSGWGIHLWASSRNVIVRNHAQHSVRCEAAGYSRGCDSAALLLRERSDSNLVADNDLTWSGDGFFLSGQPPLLRPSIGNLVLRNDASFAYHNAFESTFSEWNVFLENHADSSAYGFWLGYSRGNSVRRNSVIGSRMEGIAIEHGGETDLGENVIIGGQAGIRLSAPREGDPSSQGYRVDDNTIAKTTRGLVLQATTRSRVRGNLFDQVDDALVADTGSADAQVSGNVFLTVRRWFIDAPSLEAGGNFWAATDVDSVSRQIRGRVAIVPFRRAVEAGY